MSADAPDMVSIPRADLEALQAELRRLRQQQGDRIALARITSDPGLAGSGAERTLTRTELAEAWGVGD